MLRTDKAVLKGDRLEWSGGAPEHPRPEHAVAVHVTLPDESPDMTAKESRGRQMAEALERIAAVGALAEMKHPEQWQREVRRDRSLPDREI